MPVDRIMRAARTGWTPATLVGVLVVALQLAGGVSPRDLVAFGLYASLALVLPGTLLWRLLSPAGERPWLEDVVLGAILAYAVEIACYLPARAAGLPLLVLAWPVVVYVVCLFTERGRAAWRPDAVTRVSPSWAWSLGGITSYLVLFVARASWSPGGVTGPGLRALGPDGSFQLALVGEIRHHMPGMIPFVADAPLQYHWLTFAHLAAASWTTGIEPTSLLRRLAPTLMMLLIVLAVALIAGRLSRRPAVGPLAAGLLVCVHSPAFAPAEADHFQRQEFTSQSIFGSPTMTFGSLLFCGVLFLTLEVLDGRTSRTTWPLLVLLLAATSGTKATFAPMMVAGALTVVAVAAALSILRRHHVALLGVSAVNWLAFQLGFYAGGETGAALTARGTLDFAAASIGAITPEPISGPGLAFAATVVVLWAVHMSGMLGQLRAGGWREPSTLFAYGFTASGIGASLFLDLPAFSQQWFVNSTQVVVAICAAHGFSRLVPPGRLRPVLPLVTVSALLGASGMAVGWGLGDTSVPTPGPTLTRLWEYAAPFWVTVAAVLAAGVVLARVAAPVPRHGIVVLLVAAGLTGLGLFRTTQLGVALAQVPWQRAALPAPNDTMVGRGGVEAARWVRDHSEPDELLATNAHQMTPSSDHDLAFWLAGYAERRVLVEGWGYTTRHARIVAHTGVDYADVPFWDQELLAANDLAFTDPDRGAVETLREEYGVTWLVLDRRFPSDPAALSEVVAPAFLRGDYVVYRLS